MKESNLNFFVEFEDRVDLIDLILSYDNLSMFELMFGFISGFGGYSNLLLEFFVRNGLLGVSIYVFIFVFFSRRYYQILKNYKGIASFENKNIVLFIIFSALIGNFVNINFAAPYYVTNFASLIFTFNSLDK